MGKGYAKDNPVVDTSVKSAPRGSSVPDASLQLQQQAGNQAVQGLLKDTPTFDDYEYRTQGRVPSTRSGQASPFDLARNQHLAASSRVAVANFLGRFPFLKELTEAYKSPIDEILNRDEQNLRDLYRVNTDANWMSLKYSGSPSAGAMRLQDLQKFELPSLNARRVEKITTEAILSNTPAEPPSSPFQETDSHTYLRETWKKFREQAVYLTIDGWSDRALQIYITDGTLSWEVLSSPRPIEMDDLLSIGRFRDEYIRQETAGPKRVALQGMIREAAEGLAAAQTESQSQEFRDRVAAPLVVPLSKWRGKRAGFAAVEDSYTSMVYAEVIEKKRVAYEPTYLEQIGFLLAGFADAIDALTPKDALEAQYLRGLTEDQRKERFWKNIPTHYAIELEIHRDLLKLTDDEWAAVKKEGNARAEKDWEQAPEALPDEASFNRVAEIIDMAVQYLDAGDMDAASIYGSLALQMEQQLATSVARYETRVETGAGLMVETLQHVEAGAHLVLAVLAPFGAAELGFTGLRALAFGAGAPAVFTAASGIISGEGAAHSLFDAGKEFISGLLIGKLSEMMSARFVVRFGLPRPIADILGNVAASPYGLAGDVLLRKMMDPKAPLPTLGELEAEMWKGVVVGSLVTMATHSAMALRKPVDLAGETVVDPTGGTGEPEGTPGPPNKMSGTATSVGSSGKVAKPSKAAEKFAHLNDEWTTEMRMQGSGPVNVRPASSEPELGWGIFKRNMATPAEAYDAFGKAVARTKNREVGILRNIETGEYIVQVGHRSSVGPGTGLPGHFEMVLHTHPNEGNILTYRLPSGGDVMLAQEASARLGGRPVTQFIEYPLPAGGRGRTAYTVDATGKVKVEFVRTRTGKAETLEFSSPQEFQEYWGSRKRAVAPGSEDYLELMDEADQVLNGRVSPASRDNSMARQYGPSFEDAESIGYDSKMGIRKRTVTPQDVVREQQLRDYKLEKVTKGIDQNPEYRELLWELEDINMGQPDPLAQRLAMWRGTARDQQFQKFILPKIKEIMPPDSAFGTGDWADFERVLNIKKVPWNRSKGPDFFLVKGNRIKPLDLTSRGSREAVHLAEKVEQTEALQELLGNKWIVEDVEHFYYGGGAFNEARAINDLAPILKGFGAKLPPLPKPSK